MGSRRAAHARLRRGGLRTPPQSTPCLRREAHTAIRKGGVLRQENESSMEGPDDSKIAAKPSKAWKPRKAS